MREGIKELIRKHKINYRLLSRHSGVEEQRIKNAMSNNEKLDFKDSDIAKISLGIRKYISAISVDLGKVK